MNEKEAGKQADKAILNEETPAPSYFAKILDAVKAPEPEFEVMLLGGFPLKFKIFQGEAEFKDVTKLAGEFADLEVPPPAFAPYWSEARDTKVWCFILGAMCVTDKGTPDAPGAIGFLKLQHESVIVYQTMLAQFKAKLVHIERASHAEGVAKAKKGSRSRSRGGNGSRSAGTPGTSTRKK